jgi:hypothetical protein
MYTSPKLRPLTEAEISRLAAKSGVRKVAVENFLMSLDDLDVFSANLNLSQDARAYGWNSATQTAIRQGIDLAAKARKVRR